MSIEKEGEGCPKIYEEQGHKLCEEKKCQKLYRQDGYRINERNSEDFASCFFHDVRGTFFTEFQARAMNFVPPSLLPSLPPPLLPPFHRYFPIYVCLCAWIFLLP